MSALVWGPFADRYGRRRTMLIASALFTGFSIACLFSPNVESERACWGPGAVRGAAAASQRRRRTE